MSYRRIPFKLLSYDQREIAVPKELLMDYNTGNLYIKINENEYINVGREIVLDLAKEELEKITAGVREDGNTFRKLRELIAQLELWKNTLEDASHDNILNIIYDKLRDLPDDGTTILQLIQGKVDKVNGKILVSNDFTNELLQKLNSIEYNANYYNHPQEKQCNYTPPVTSINGKSDENIILTKKDFGLENVEENANRYVHPSARQCNVTGITSVNNKTGNVTLTKSDIGLGNLENYDMATNEDVKKWVNNKYLNPATFKFGLEKYLFDYVPPKYNLTFNINKTGATIKVNGIVWNSNTGQVYEGFNTYEISKTGYETIIGNIIIEEDTVLPIILRKVFTLSFNVTPFDATIKVNGTVWDSKSKTVVVGTYEYEVYKSGYIKKTGTVKVDTGNKSVTVDLIPELTGITATIDPSYASSITTRTIINKDYITVIAKYADNSTKILKSSEFSITPNKFNNVGTQNITVSYTDTNITKTTTIQVFIDVKVLIKFTKHSGSSPTANIDFDTYYYLDEIDKIYVNNFDNGTITVDETNNMPTAYAPIIEPTGNKKIVQFNSTSSSAYNSIYLHFSTTDAATIADGYFDITLLNNPKWIKTGSLDPGHAILFSHPDYVNPNPIKLRITKVLNTGKTYSKELEIIGTFN